MLKQSLSHKMLQKLSPQQIQLMKLLQIPTAILDQRIKEELESNPALDEGDSDNDIEAFDMDGDSDERESKEDDDFELDDYINDYLEDDPITYKLKSDNYGEPEEKSVPISVVSTFHEHLERQLGMVNFVHPKDELLARQVIGSIDEDGYLRREPEDLIDDMLFNYNVDCTKQEILNQIVVIQGFDPPGVGARDLQECLILQMDIKISQAEPLNRRSKEIAKIILEKYFDEFAKKHFTKLKKHLNLSDCELKDAIDEVLKLNPKPASNYLGNSYENHKQVQQYVLPDFIINNRDGLLELSLNSKNAPDLRINDHYVDVLQSFKDTTTGRRATKQEKEAVMFIKQKIDSAKWFIDAIKQRQDTLYNTMYTIMKYQEEFFLSGDERRLRPMILKDIADVTSLDISTVSRVANSKFVQTEFGTKKLKDFFSESITTSDGEEVSTFEVKNILTDVIQREDKRNPLSDEKLKDILQEKGYNIARRTIAKYREQLNIAVARLRKEL